QRHKLPGPVGRDTCFIELHRTLTSAALRRVSLAGVIDEDLTHAPRCDGEEVGSVRELELRTAGKPEKCLGDQLGWTERMARPLPSQVDGGQPPELLVDQRRNLVEGGAISLPPSTQQVR